MRKAFSFLLILILLFLSSSATAGEMVKAGEILKEDSYVFSIEAAKDLMNKYSFFEKEYNKHLQLIEKYKNLDIIQNEKLKSKDELLSIKKLEIDEYKKIKTLDQERIIYLEKRVKVSKLERVGYFGLGAGTVILALILADKLDDSVETVPTNSNNGALFRF